MTSEVIKTLETIGEGFELFRKTHDRRLGEFQERLELLESKRDRPGATAGGTEHSRDAREHLDRFTAWLRRPTDGSTKRQLDEAQAELERKDVLVASGATGGYAVPEIIYGQIEARARIQNPFRQICRVVPVGSRDFKALVSTNDSTSGWVAESGSRAATTTSELRERAPSFGTLYSYVSASEEAMQDVFFDVQSWLIQEAGDGFAAAEATAFVSGNGSARPTGFLNASPVTSPDGASPERAAGTLQYVPCDAKSPQSVNMDDIIDLVGTLHERYQADPSCAFVMSRTTASFVRKLKDSYGQYLWQPSTQAGVPASLLGFPVYLSSAMPALTADQFPIAFGAWSRGYVIADRVGAMRATVDDSITSPGTTKFYIRKVVGGCILNSEALKVLKLADS